MDSINPGRHTLGRSTGWERGIGADGAFVAFFMVTSQLRFDLHLSITVPMDFSLNVLCFFLGFLADLESCASGQDNRILGATRQHVRLTNKLNCKVWPLLASCPMP
jgi:hypothetical protein